VGDKYTTVKKRPPCDICAEEGVTTPAYADAKIRSGPWAWVCRRHFREYNCAIGMGRGQEIVVR
jgi:hypothetical protein